MLMTDPDFSPAMVAKHARNRLYTQERHAPEDLQHSDHAIAGMNPDSAVLGAAKPAAVLIPLISRGRETTVLLTQRSDHLRQHSGQIAFPGGKVDADDDGAMGAALREAEEEIGLSRDAVEPLGFLGPYFSTTGYRILPVVGLIQANTPLNLNPIEVADTFEVPLSFLMNPGNHRTDQREFQGQMRRFFAMPFEDRYIWGVTAGIIRMLWLKLYAPHSP
jgi:8-oxo-dGTP pyrophosphatase MutT (NUDIX family)